MSSSDRFPYLTATVLDQTFLDACHDNLACDLEMICDIGAPDGSTIRASDRNKYVGDTFYEALMAFPVMRRTIGEWLQGALEFSRLELALSNVDQRFNPMLQGGADFGGGWVGNEIMVKIGLRDVESTYKTIFRGSVTPEGGFGRDVRSIKLISRDGFDALNTEFPTALFTIVDYPLIQDKWLGKAKPIIYGDWTVVLSDRPAVVPAIPVNGADDDVVQEDGLRNPLNLVISQNANREFDVNNVWVRRGQQYLRFDPADISGITSDKNSFTITQNGTLTGVDEVVADDPFLFGAGDEFFVLVKGKDLSTYSDNFVEIARDIMITYGTAISGDFHANWDTFRDKASPVQSAIVNMKCRIWQQDSVSALSMALSLLEQVRLEAFIDRDFKIKINSLHFDDFDAAPSFTLRNWDVVKDTFQPAIDQKNNFNRTKGFFARMPDSGQNELETPFFNNAGSIAFAGSTITKGLVYPNHYIAADVYLQTKETLRLASAFFEVIPLETTWRTLLLDIGDFVKLDVQIQSVIYQNVPCLIREVGWSPKGMKRPMSIWCLQTVSFPGYTPVVGSVGGYDAVITEES